MKKLLALACVGLTVAVITACGKTATPASDEAAQPSQPAAAETAAQPSTPPAATEATTTEPAGEATPPADEAPQQ